jgi:hypothetical protein
MSAEANKALVRRFYEEIDKGNLERWMNWWPQTTSITTLLRFRFASWSGRIEAGFQDLLGGDSGISSHRRPDRRGGQGGDAPHFVWKARRRSPWCPADWQ